MAETKQLSVPAVLALGAISFAPVLGAGIAIAQHSLDPFGYGAVAAVGLFLAYLVGTAVAQAREARRIALRAENEVHPDRGELEAEIDRLNSQVRSLTPRPCWSCGRQPVDVDVSRDGGLTWDPAWNRRVVRLGSESGKREPDVTDMTRSPDPDHPGA